MSISQECLWISSCLFSLIHGFFFLTVVDCDVVHEALEVPESSHSSNIQTPLRHFDWSVSPSLAALAIYVAFHSIEVVDKVGFIPTRWLHIEKKCFNKILSYILIFKSLQLKYFAMSSMELKVKKINKNIPMTDKYLHTRINLRQFINRSFHCTLTHNLRCFSLLYFDGKDGLSCK